VRVWSTLLAAAALVLGACGSTEEKAGYEREMRALLADLNAQVFLPSFEYADDFDSPDAPARRRAIAQSYLRLAARAEQIDPPADVADAHARFVTSLRESPPALDFGPPTPTKKGWKQLNQKDIEKVFDESNAKLKPLDDLERALDEIERSYDIGWAEPPR
jgi:hypothetical protein